LANVLRDDSLRYFECFVVVLPGESYELGHLVFGLTLNVPQLRGILVSLKFVELFLRLIDLGLVLSP
jgi:hypothetical protein